MTPGIQTLFGHITLWSQIPSALIVVDPMELSGMAATPRETIESLNGYLRAMRIQEIGLLKSLSINPDQLTSQLAKGRRFPDIFLNLEKRPDWMATHPNIGLTVDDFHQMRQAIIGAKRRLNDWDRRVKKSRRPKALIARPAGLHEHIKWLWDITGARVELARVALLMGEQDEVVRQFFNEKIRTARNITTIEDSLRTYLNFPRSPI